MKSQTKVADICLCGFRYDQHACIAIDLMKEMKVDEQTMEILKESLERMQATFIEQSLLYGQAACFNYKRNNLIYLEQVSLEREEKANG